MMWPIIRNTRDHFFSKLDFLKTVSVTIIAKNRKSKNPISLWPLHFLCLLLLVSRTDFFKNFSPYPSFWIFHFLPSKKRSGTGRGYRTMCIHLKLPLYNIWLFLCVLVGAYRRFLKVFTAFGHVWYGFMQKYSELPFLWQNNTDDKQ